MAGRTTVSQVRPEQEWPAETTAAGAGGDPRAPGTAAPAARAPDLPPLVGLLRPLIDVVASIPVSVHAKLLAGFLASALLLLAMGLLSLAMIDRMGQRVDELDRLQEKVDHSRQMEYLVTAQSHYRAMALLTRDDSNNEKIANAKKAFVDHLNAVVRLSPPEQQEFLSRVREADGRFAASSERVLGLYRAGNIDDAMRLHLSEEHPISHELEAAMLRLQTDAVKEMRDSRAQIAADRGLLSAMVGGFSALSLGSALLLGLVLSWAFVRPVRKIDYLLAGLAQGNFTQRVAVPNQDEFGTLSKNLNTVSAHLASVYHKLESMNANLQHQVHDQLDQLEKVNALKRYLSPQLADSIVAGDLAVTLASRRKQLTVCFVDVRGFSAIAERYQPEELVDLLNAYLNAMTEIVFKYGGTLDKYVGEQIKVFFGDPVAYEDHAVRAVRMALEMRRALATLQQAWFMEAEEILTLGIGISTGYVTVGNIGSTARLDYTVIGNHVSLAGRLAERAQAGQVLVSERTLLAVRDFVAAREVDEGEREGVSRPIKIYEIEARQPAGAGAGSA
jgi:class 3 adenylate cyclase/CHASE3 domain sensor protein